MQSTIPTTSKTLVAASLVLDLVVAGTLPGMLLMLKFTSNKSNVSS